MKNILVLKNRAFGDSVIGLGAIQYVKKIFPNALITYGVPRWVAPLYKNIDGAADSYLPISLNGIKDCFLLWREVRRGSYDLIIELQQSGRTGRFFKFLFRKKYFYHNHNQIRGNFIIDQGVRKPIIQRDLDGCFSVFKKLFGFEARPQHLDYQPRIDVPSARGFDKKRIVLGLVATRKSKMWSLENYAEVVQSIDDNLYEFVVPLSNSEQDRVLESLFKNLCPNVTIIKKELSELPLELTGASCYLGNDTGLKHLCVALGVPTFSFFGPEEPLEWHPYDLEKNRYYFISKLECRTRTGHYCGLDECDSMVCMNGISSRDVISDLTFFLDQNTQ